MRRVLLLSAGAVMILVPAVSGFYAALFPRQSRILPMPFWLLWLVISLCVTLYAPAAIAHLTPSTQPSHRCAAYARWGVALGIINLVCSVAEIVVLG